MATGKPDCQPFFQHQLLSNKQDHVRLCTLMAGESDQIIECRLSEHRLSDKPFFSALSYEWGPRRHRRTIMVDGQYFLIRPNLFNFLLELRSPIIRSVIWADAICIDQENDDERRHQVSLMHKIYEQANDVFAWLGPARERSDEVLSMIGSFKLQPKTPPSTLWCAHGHMQTPQYSASELFTALCKQRLVQPFCDFLWRGFWKRIWILQEMSFGVRIILYCGSRTIDLDILGHFVTGHPVRALHLCCPRSIVHMFLEPQGLPKNSFKVCTHQMTITNLCANTTCNNTGLDWRVIPRERPFPAYLLCGVFCFTFSRPVGSQCWEIEGLEDAFAHLHRPPGAWRSVKWPSSLSAGDQQSYEFRSLGPLSFDNSGILCITDETFNPDVMANDVLSFIFGMYRTPAETIIRQRYEPASRRSMVNTLCTGQRLHCEDQRDHIFGLIGLFGDSHEIAECSRISRQLFQPSYDWTPTRTLLEFLKFYKPRLTIYMGCLVMRALDLDKPGNNRELRNEVASIQREMSRADRSEHGLIISLKELPPIWQRDLQALAEDSSLYLVSDSSFRQDGPEASERNCLVCLPTGPLCRGDIFLSTSRLDEFVIVFRPINKDIYRGIGMIFCNRLGFAFQREDIDRLKEAASYTPEISVNFGEPKSEFWKNDPEAIPARISFLCLYLLCVQRLKGWGRGVKDLETGFRGFPPI